MAGRTRIREGGSTARRGVLVALIAALLVVPALAVDGEVVDVTEEAIAGARVCYVVDNVELLCVETDSNGWFQLPSSGVDTMRAHAEGYNPASFSAAGLDGPVTLEKAAVLLVRLVDRESGERIQKGEVLVVYPSGKEEGPFPSNAAGVRIRRGLAPGEVRLVGKAVGFKDSQPHGATLKAGLQVEVVLELDAIPTDDGAD